MWQTILDIVFPPSEDQLLVRDTTPDSFTCYGAPRNTDGVHALLPYREKRVRACIHEAKFHHNEQALELLGSVLRTYVESLGNGATLLIPIPLSRQRMRERGYNQVEEIAKVALRDNPRIRLETNILKRNRNTKPQADLPRETRLVNILNAFTCHNGEEIRDKHIILLDDVLTTGATMRTAKAVLTPFSPASIICIAIAH